MATVRRQTKAQLEFMAALDALLREQNHPFALVPSAMVVVNSVEVRTENKQVLAAAGVQEQQGGVYHYRVAFTLHVPKHKRLPQGYDADATAEESWEEIEGAEPSVHNRLDP